MLFLWSSQSKEAYFDFIMYTSTFWEHNVLRDIQWNEKESTYFGEQKTSTHTNWCSWGMPPTCLHGTELTLRLSIGNCVSELKGKSEHLGAVGFCLNNGAGRRHLQRGGGDHSWENATERLGLLQNRAICKILHSRAISRRMKMEKIHRVIFWW